MDKKRLLELAGVQLLENVSLQLDGVDVETLKYAVQLALDALRDDVEAPEDYLRSLEKLQKQLHR